MTQSAPHRDVRCHENGWEGEREISTGQEARTCEVPTTSIPLKAVPENPTFDHFFKSPNTKQANKITPKFSGIPDVNLSFILSKNKKKSVHMLYR